VSNDRSGRLLQHRLEVHDRKQLELKLELQPTGEAKRVRYWLELFFHVPGSLYINSETYPKADVFAGVHNYVRLKTPNLSFQELLTSEASPLVGLERWAAGAGSATENEIVQRAKLLACVVRGALRRFASNARTLGGRDRGTQDCPTALRNEADVARASMKALLERYRTWMSMAELRLGDPRSRTALGLVDEYLSLSLEQFFRMVVARMELLPHDDAWGELRRGLLNSVLEEERYRVSLGLTSVLSLTGDNEEYMHRMGMLKKFCMQALFLSTHPTQTRANVEELLLALAAGGAMMLATAIGLFAQVRFDQLSSSFFFILIASYMMKDRLKEALRRVAARVATRHLFDRDADVRLVSGGRDIARERDKVEYLTPAQVPDELLLLRREDELVWATEGALSETVLRYQRELVAEVEDLPRWDDGPSGITDILRFSVDRFLRDMDEPEFALEYVDLEDFTVGHVRASKAYRVDLACRITAEEGDRRETTIQAVRLVLDRNGIKRMDRLQSSSESVRVGAAAPVRAVA